MSLWGNLCNSKWIWKFFKLLQIKERNTQPQLPPSALGFPFHHCVWGHASTCSSCPGHSFWNPKHGLKLPWAMLGVGEPGTWGSSLPLTIFKWYSLCVHACMCDVFGGQMTTFRNRLLPSTVGVLGMELRSSGVAAKGLYPASHLAGPSEPFQWIEMCVLILFAYIVYLPSLPTIPISCFKREKNNPNGSLEVLSIFHHGFTKCLGGSELGSAMNV